MTLTRLSRCAPALCLALLTAPLWAHDDDPKILDRQPPVHGPGFRAGPFGGRGGGGGNQPGAGFDSSNVTLLAWLPLDQIDNAASGNDCWGYVSPSGREYAILGTSNGTNFIEITAPTNPQIVQHIPGPVSLWRDVKTYDQYAYAVSEGGDGIQVIDLSSIDSGVVTLSTTITTGGSTASHNVAIDTTSGFLYRLGGSGHGTRVYDLANPANPQYMTTWDDIYIHDAQVVTPSSGPQAGRQLMFACGGLNNGWVQTRLAILDVTDKSNIQLLDEVFYPNAQYSHQGWLSPDLQYFYLGDELDEDGIVPSTTHVIDVSDPTNAFHVTSYDNGNTAITHNIYTRDNLVYAANYRSGLRVFDATDPVNMTEVAWFDTYPIDDDASFNGLWSCWPYFPSGTVIGSDLERGLFVWEIGEPPLDIQLPGGVPELLDPDGDALAVTITEVTPGDLRVGTERLYYDTGAGFTWVPLIDTGGGSYLAPFPPLACKTDVAWYVEAQDSLGFPWTHPVGAPSLVHTSLAAEGLAIVVDHDMENDPGWIAGAPGDTATTGIWERVDPVGTAAQPEDDHSPAGTRCWVTGQGSVGGGLGDNDVDDGFTTLLTPAFDMTGFDDPSIRYWRWYSNDQGSDPNTDVLRVEIDDGGGWVTVEVVGPAGIETAGGWYCHVFRVADLVSATSSVRLRFIAEDAGGGSIVEAAIDDFQVFETICDLGPGTNYCGPAQTNSSGLPGLISSIGSDVVADNDLTLVAEHLPPARLAFLLVGPVGRGGSNRSGGVGGSGGPHGGLCLGVPFSAFHLTAGTTDGLGTIQFPVDLTGVPTYRGPRPILPGETWYFQVVYRDVSARLFTDGLRIGFQ